MREKGAALLIAQKTTSSKELEIHILKLVSRLRRMLLARQDILPFKAKAVFHSTVFISFTIHCGTKLQLDSLYKKSTSFIYNL